MGKFHLDTFKQEQEDNNRGKIEELKRDKIGDNTSEWVNVENTEERESLRLMYVDTVDTSEKVHVCYFSIEDPELVIGDDWDDVPYEHNAGLPRKYDYYVIAVNVTSPSYGHLNSPYSVEMINRKEVPWLTDEEGNTLYAGSTVRDFIDFMKRAPYGLYF